MSKAWSGHPLQLRTIETGGGGDCLFHALGHAISSWLQQRLTMKDVRDELAETITPRLVRRFIKDVREDHASFIPGGAINWNLLKFNVDDAVAVRQVQRLVKKHGGSFQGSDVALRQIINHSRFMRRNNVGAVVLTKFGPGHSQVFPDPHKSPQRYYVVLYCNNNAHWQVGQLRNEATGSHLSILTHQKLMEWMPLI